MITVGYEQDRGLREQYERPDGYEISVSKTIPISIADLFQAWQNEDIRFKWLPEKNVIIRKATENKSMRMGWIDEKTRLSIDFYSLAKDKSKVVVQHCKLNSLDQAEEMKKYWKERLESLKNILSES